jgi:hypothetical protein
MNSDEDKFYIKIVAIDTIYNFIVDMFFIWKCLEPQNIVSKVILLNTIYNFVVEKFSRLESQICVIN